MNKRALTVLMLFICVVVLLFAAEENPGSQRLSQLYVDSQTWEQLMSERQAFVSNDPIFHAVYLNGYEPAYDRDKKLLLYSLIEDSALAYDPPIRVSCASNDIEVAILGSPISDELIRNNESIFMMFYTDTHYEIYELKCTTLPVIEIQISAVDIPKNKEAVSTRFSLFDNRKGVFNRVVENPATIHLRGNHVEDVFGYHKKDYRISLQSQSAGKNIRKNHVSLLGLRQDDDWILKGQYNDKDKIREVFSTNLWYHSCSANNAFRIANGTQYKYVEVFIGQEYMGIYGLCYPIDAKLLGIANSDHFYKKNDTRPETEIDFNQIGALPGYEYRGNNFENPDWEPLRHYYRMLLNTQHDHASDLYEITDVENAIDIFLFLNLIQGIDHAHVRDQNAVYNLFFSAKAGADKKTRILYTPWDMDRTWGMEFDDEITIDPSFNVIIDTSIVTRLLEMNDQKMARMVIERYKDLRNNQWSDQSLKDMLLDLEKDVFHSGAYARDYQRWYAFRGWTPPESYADFIDRVHMRMQYMDDYVGDLANQFGLRF